MKEMTDKTYKAAIIGCGRVAWLLDKDPLIPNKPCTHAGAYQDVDRTETVAAADIRADRIHAFSKEYNINNVYLDYGEMLEKESPDIVSICAYAPQRFNMVVDSINAGVKGIWCEKAFATSLSEAYEMVRLCEERGESLIVSHMRRWSSDYILAKKLISDGAIGEPVSVVCHFSGSMIHTGTHAFDVLRFLFGDAVWVQGSLEDFGLLYHHKAFESTRNLISQDSGGFALIYFKNGVYATVHADSKGYFLFEFDIMGTEGRIRIGNWLFELYVPEESKTESGLIELYSKELHFDENNRWIDALNHLIDCMEGRAENMSGPRDATAALEIALAIHASHQREGTRVDLPLENRELRVLSR
jgi:predicted dehydrogenase